MESLNADVIGTAGLDWPSLSFALLIACITAACLWIKSAYPRIAAAGTAGAVLANVVIGYFGLGMMAFGVSSAMRGSLPVPGGAAWEGPIALIGGMAAVVVGTTTLAEHVAQVVTLRRAALATPLSGAAGAAQAKPTVA